VYRRHNGVSASDTDGEAVVVAGYLPDYRAYIDINAAAIHLTDLMLFSMTPESILQQSSSSSPGRCCVSSEHYAKVREARSYARQHSKKMRVLLTIGGGGRSNGFREVVTGKSEIQRRFLENLLELCREEELDGIDLDYEGMALASEWKAYLRFLPKAATFLHEHGLLLTVALHPGQLLPSEVCQNIDRVHIMTYDMMHPASWSHLDKRNNHHASIYSAREELLKFVQNGCPPSKLIMGVPAYGRHEQQMGLVKTYSEVVDEIMKKDRDSKEITQKIQSMQSWNGYQFDSPSDIKAKVGYAKDNGLGGVFIWELGQDKQMTDVANGGILLEAASSVANGGDEL